MSSSSTPPKVIKALCSTCSLRELCLPVGLMQDEVNQLDAVIRQSRRLKKGEYLFRVAEPFKSLYAIRTGFFKTAVASQDGRDQVTGFFMSGALLGMDGTIRFKYSQYSNSLLSINEQRNRARSRRDVVVG